VKHPLHAALLALASVAGGPASAIAQDQPSFATMDRNGDGVVDKGDFVRLARTVYNTWDTSKDRQLSEGEIATAMFAAWDASADGTLDDDELSTGFALFFDGAAPEAAHLDADGSRLVEGDEFLAWAAAHQDMRFWTGDPANLGGSLFKRMDTNGDGAISAAEMEPFDRMRLVIAGASVPDADTGAVEEAILTQEATPISDWEFARGRMECLSARRLLDGLPVVDETGAGVGRVWDAIFSAQGEIVSVIVETGGLWGMFERLVNVPVSRARVSTEQVVAPLSRDAVENLSAPPDGLLSAEAAGSGIMQVPYNVFTQADCFRISYLIGDYARMRGDSNADDGYMRVGPITDAIVQDGRIEAVIVKPEEGVLDVEAHVALPFIGHGVQSRARMYTLPYGVEELANAPRVNYRK